MNAIEKIKNIPTVYYFNRDIDVDRREYMEHQFSKYCIHNYNRVSQDGYLKEDWHDWKNELDNYENIECLYQHLDFHSYYKHVGSILCHMNTFKDWINNTNEDYLIIMEDDYDLSLIERWHFTWEYLMKRLPYDWDCLQFSFEIPINGLYPMFLHPKPKESVGFGAMMLTRHYVKKLLSISYDDKGKLITQFNTGFSKEFLDAQGGLNRSTCSIDTYIGNAGTTYRIPLITMNYDFFRKEQKKINPEYHQLYCEQIVKKWWKHKRDNFSLEDFFTFGKPYDGLMIEEVNEENAFF